ncbi:alpha/beta fold hydrolase [Yinghuangia seranimata]|uniref:alpha/beta fold hydrolase n=1 Tax=Yinghuangia seranimata TaxID=408067 RepID=UPI00248B8640|nr:alpha/beta hydrolase [Yinghuangia seranimata]MDI2127239.1 alpha/beta hydrolase [Yinghuangia seranimata]
MAEVQANGLRFHVQHLRGGRATTDRPTVVLLHGLVLDNLSSLYYTLAPPIARAGFDVLMYDQRGHGLSDRTPTGYDVDTAVDDLTAVLKACGVTSPVHLLGNSYGGLTALHTAYLHPELVASLILVEGQCLDPEHSGAAPGAGGYAGGWVEDISNTLNLIAIGLECNPLGTDLVSRTARKAARMRATADALLNRTTLIEDVTTVRLLTSEQLAAVPCPVLALFGAGSNLVDSGPLLAEHLPDCTVEVFPDAAHALLRDAPERLLASVLTWLDTRSPASTAFTRRGTDYAARSSGYEAGAAGHDASIAAFDEADDADAVDEGAA